MCVRGWMAGAGARVLLALLACGCAASSKPPIRAAQVPSERLADRPRVKPTASPAMSDSYDAGVARPVFSGCVLHTGEIEKHRHAAKLPGGGPGPVTLAGSCSLDAECVQHHGQSTPGDGLVELRCDASVCTCRLEPLTPPGQPVHFEFTIDTQCTTFEQARRFLLERCMAGMTSRE